MTARAWGALATLYVVWGSTYLAIRYVVESLPALLSAGARFAAAGLLLAAAIWVIAQNFGGLYTGQATDPNTAPLVMLMAVALLAVDRGRLPIRRTAPAAGGAFPGAAARWSEPGSAGLAARDARRTDGESCT